MTRRTANGLTRDVVRPYDPMTPPVPPAPAAPADLARLMRAAEDARALFQWYADEHVAAGKGEKAARNQGAADALAAALDGMKGHGG